MRTLYHSPLCPFSRKIRISLKEKELRYEAEEVPFWDRPEGLLQLNPAAEVPVLIETDGTVLCDSIVISEFMEERYTQINLLGQSATERAEVRRLMLWFDLKFYREVSRNLLFEKHFKRLMGYGEPLSDAIRAGKSNILPHLEYFGYLLRQRKWLAGERLSLADVTAAAHLSSLDYFGDVPWEHSAEVQEWYALMKSRPSMRPLLADHVKGVRPPPHYDNPDF